MVGRSTMIDEEMRKRLGKLDDVLVDVVRHGLRFVYWMRVEESNYKRPNKADLAWTVRGSAGAISFSLSVEELGPDRPRVMFPRTVAALHRRAPSWMKDRTCLHLGGFFCECTESEYFGKALFRLWYERGDGPDTVWDALLDAYLEAFPEEVVPDDLTRPVRIVALEQGCADRRS